MTAPDGARNPRCRLEMVLSVLKIFATRKEIKRYYYENRQAPEYHGQWNHYVIFFTTSAS